MSVERPKEPENANPSASQSATIMSPASALLRQPVASSDRPPHAASGHEHVGAGKLFLALVIVLASAFVLALHLQSFFGDDKFQDIMMSGGMRARLKSLLPSGLPLERLFAGTATIGLIAWLVGAVAIAVLSWSSWFTILWKWGVRFLWLGVLALFESLWATGGTLTGASHNVWLARLVTCLPFFHTIAWGGLLASAWGLLTRADRSPSTRSRLAHPAVVWCAAAVYAVTFSVLSILQYQALMVPHGDSAMYEEHLWNLLHGKGFRSQLDGGRLFFGEHLEVIHLFLLPVYVLLPTLPTLNVCLTLGLASGAIAIRGFARRVIGSDSAANWLAIAYLLYFPLQYLNLEVTLKTFRPENFGVPLLLFAIWCLEANRLRTMLVLMVLTLGCKEDYAIPVGMLGLYLAVRRGSEPTGRNARLLGVAVFALATAYLWFVVNVFIPHFRGEPPHYLAYYPSELGQSPSQIVVNCLRQPGVVFGYILTRDNLGFLLMLVIPLAGLPLVGLGRLWVLLPTLASILLLQLKDAHTPMFHFHAPLVPVLFWSAAEGLRRLLIVDGGWRNRTMESPRIASWHQQSAISSQRFLPTRAARFAAACALVSGIWAGKSPMSVAFYDPAMGKYGFGRVLYVPSGIELERVHAFERLFPLIAPDASVAATDFVRPRFTHHRECHQYGEGGLKPHVRPESIDYIVVDLLGPYSDWLRGRRIREEEDPDQWEVMNWDEYGEFFFHVVRKKQGGGVGTEHSQ